MQRIGVVTEKSTPDFIMVVHLVSPDERYDQLYLSNFATLRVKDELARIPGVGSAQVFGAGEYSMRVWLDPESAGLAPADDDATSFARSASRTCRWRPASSARRRRRSTRRSSSRSTRAAG